jgi:hypothetical protein
MSFLVRVILVISVCSITSDMEEGSASLFCAVGLDEAKLHVRESAVELGQARIFENCFCAIDREIFRVEECAPAPQPKP